MRLLRFLPVLGFLWAAALCATAETDRQRWNRLRTEIAHHDELYFRRAAPEISDTAYDHLKRELAALERAHPGWASSRENIGDDRTGRFPTYVHRARMLSLDKVYTEAEWRAFHAAVAARLGRGDFPFVVEPKYDGLAISVTYDHGVLVRAATRGDGREGDDVTANVRTITTLPGELAAAAPDGSPNPIPDLVELRGEIYFEDAEFARINTERTAAGEEPFAHPRNLAAGTLKSLDPGEVAQRQLSLVLYGWGAWEGPGVPATQRELHARIRSWGLPGMPRWLTGRTADEGWAAIRQFGRERRTLGFPVDGAVVKLDDVPARAALGENEHAPHWAVAYKYEPERVVGHIRAITLQVGRTGVLTPVAELDPVKLSGTTITRATLHNRALLARRDVREGDFVEIEKAGEVIPAVGAVQLDRRPPGSVRFAFPARCPSCDAPVQSKPGEVAVRCLNPDCSAQRQRRLEHFVSPQAVDIRGFGPAMIALLNREGLLRTPADFYQLRRTDLDGVKGIGAQTADNLLAAIERSRRVDRWRFIYGLSIPEIGKANAQKLAAACDDFEALSRLTAEQLAKIVGAASAPEAAAFLSRAENQAMMRDLNAALARPR
jgi:DNA ligase (NAD+)